MKDFLIVLAIVVPFFLLWATAMWFFVMVPTRNFYMLRTELEFQIRNVDNQEEQVKLLYELAKKSWHRTTGEEINRLASMMEVKYKIKLLKDS